MFALRGEDREEPAEADVLQVGSTELLAASASRFRHVDAVLFDEFAVDDGCVFVGWDVAGYVEQVTVSQIATGNLLHESFQ